MLRAVNVGGTGKLSMPALRELCVAAGFANPRTWIASGNVVFGSDKHEAEVKAALERGLEAHVGRRVGVIVRTGAEMSAVLAANPFPGWPANRTVAVFLDAAPGADALEDVSGQGDERLALGAREVWIAYGGGMADSKLKIPAARSGTARNLNTIAKLAEWASA